MQLRQFYNFVLAGAISACCTFITRLLLQEVITYEESLVYSYIVGTVTAYGLYKSTFGRESGDVNSRIKFTIVNLLGLAQTTIVSLIVCRYLSLCMALHHAQAAAHFIGLASLTVPSYYAHLYFTFAKQNNERELSNILQNAQK